MLKEQTKHFYTFWPFLLTSVLLCVDPWQTSMIRLLVFLPPELPGAIGEFGVCNSSIKIKGKHNHTILYNNEIVAPNKQLEYKKKNSICRWKSNFQKFIY